MISKGSWSRKSGSQAVRGIWWMLFGVETARNVGLGLSVKRKSVSQHQARISLFVLIRSLQMYLRSFRLLRNQTATLLNLDNRPFSAVSQIHNTNKPLTTFMSRSMLMNIHYYGTNDRPNTQKARMPKIGKRMPTCICVPARFLPGQRNVPEWEHYLYDILLFQ